MAYYLPRAALDLVNSDSALDATSRAKICRFLSHLTERTLLRKVPGDAIGYYANISVSLGRKLCGCHHFDLVRAYCLAKGIVGVTGSYCPGKFSKSYRLMPAFRDNIVEVDGPSVLLAFEADYSLLPALRVVTFGPGAQGALDALILEAHRGPDKVKANHKEMAARSGFRRVNEGNIWLTRAADTGRLYSAVANLPKALRAHLLLRGEDTVEIDIKNSQPFFAITLYPSRTNECKCYTKLCEAGRLYDTLNEALPVRYADRGLLKEQVFRQVYFGTADRAGYEIWRAFCGMFPELAGLIRDLKKDGKEKVALRLQSAEAEVIVHGVLADAIKDDLPAITIHDSVLVRISDAQRFEALVCAHVLRVVGVKPMLYVGKAA